jgi:hypothetical protein
VFTPSGSIRHFAGSNRAGHRQNVALSSLSFSVLTHWRLSWRLRVDKTASLNGYKLAVKQNSAANNNRLNSTSGKLRKTLAGFFDATGNAEPSSH